MHENDTGHVAKFYVNFRFFRFLSNQTGDMGFVQYGVIFIVSSSLRGVNEWEKGGNFFHFPIVAERNLIIGKEIDRIGFDCVFCCMTLRRRD